MGEDEKWEYINSLDEELLKGGVILSEWSTFLAKDAEVAYCNGANLASILTTQAAIECHMRSELFSTENVNRWNFYQLIEEADFSKELKVDLHELRAFRNKWVHVKEPWEDQHLLEQSDLQEKEIEDFAKKAIKTMLNVLYYTPWI
jgi:hypothetical protein